MILWRLRMNKFFSDNAWEDYQFWVNEDRKTLARINRLILDIERNGNEGLGRPEPLTGDLTGYWSRKINERDRLIYRKEPDGLYILACRYHYGDR